jgi:hypothetical protein
LHGKDRRENEQKKGRGNFLTSLQSFEVTPWWLLTVKIRQPSHEFTFGVGMTFVSYTLVLTPVV